MNEIVIETTRLRLVAKTLDGVRTQIKGMTADERAELSSEWLSQLESPTVDVWTLGFDMIDRATGMAIGGCGFKGPPGADRVVEIAYGVAPSYQGSGYATESAAALVAYAFRSGRVRLVRAHTRSSVNASSRVLTKCGFRAVGEVIDPEDGLVSRWEIVQDPTARRID